MSNEIKTGGPAFPEIRIQKGDNYNPSIKVYYPGMKLRDYFAAKALPAVMMETQETVPASFWDWIKHELHGHGLSFLYVNYRIVDGAHKQAAQRAYALADAMLAAREGKV